MTRRWYCIEAQRGREPEVRDRLEDQGFGAFLPLVIAMRPFRPGLLKAAAVAAFPGYLFARFDTRADRWRSILYTRGVRGLISSSPEAPIPIPERQIQVLLALGYDRPIAEDPRPALIAAGARLRVTEGAFADMQGTCLWDDGKRIGLLVDMFFGRTTKAELPRRAVVAADA